MKTAVQTLLWMALTSTLVWAETTAERELRALETARTEAIRAGDAATLEKIYADDFRGVTSGGQAVDKASILEVLKGASGGLPAEIEDLKVRIYGETAVVTGLIRLSALSQEGRVAGNSFRYTHIYARKDGRWQMIAGQSTNVPPAQTQAAPSEGYVQASEGVRLHYRKVGGGQQTVVIPWVTLSQVEELAPLAEGRTLIFYAPRGRLRSDTVESSKISFENEIADLEAVRRHFGLEKVALLGWSHYGMMTAAYSIKHPDRVTRLVQMVPTAPRAQPYLDQGMRESRSRVDGAAFNELQKRRAAGELKEPAADCRAEKRVTLPAYFGDRALAAKVPLDDCDLPNERAENLGKVWPALFASMGDWDLREDLRKLRVPRLVVAGEKDFIPMAASREWAAGMPEARLLVLRGVGHFPQVEAPETFLGAVDAFLDGGWPAGAEALPAAPATGSR